MWAAFDSWNISDSVSHAIFKASPKHRKQFFATMCCSARETELLSFSHATLRCAHKLLFAPHPSGGKNTAGQSMACWHNLSDLCNLQTVSSYSSAKTIAPTCLFSPSHLSSTGLGWQAEECRKTLFVYFASLATMSTGESFLSRYWSCYACLSTSTSKGKVDMLRNQSRGAWWSIKEKKEKQSLID